MINNTLSERVFEHIKDDILMGVMKPGDRLLYEKLAEKLNVSLTPVKEALLMLEQEGLVKTVPRKGAYVTQLTNRDVLEYTQIRLALECLAVDILCEKKEPTDFSMLRQINRELEIATKSKDTGECMNKDIKFHYAIVTLCDNKRLSDLINQLPLSNFYGHMGTQQIMVERGKLILVEHSQIIEALAAKDAGRTKSLLKQNILEPQVDYLKKLPAEEDRKSK